MTLSFHIPAASLLVAQAHRLAMAGWFLQAVVATLLTLVFANDGSQVCRDCSVGDCLSIPRAEGGCEACICNGLLMPECESLNCPPACAQERNLEGCTDCVCAEYIPTVCAPIPACPSNCQIKLGDGCPRCTCPDELPSVCPVVTCPEFCNEVVGQDGCPACECPPENRVCPSIPACPLGCIGESDDPEFVGCLSCNCTLADDLLRQNQVLPDEYNPEVPAIDGGLIEDQLENLPPAGYDTEIAESVEYDTEISEPVENLPPVEYDTGILGPVENLPPAGYDTEIAEPVEYDPEISEPVENLPPIEYDTGILGPIENLPPAGYDTEIAEPVEYDTEIVEPVENLPPVEYVDDTFLDPDCSNDPDLRTNQDNCIPNTISPADRPATQQQYPNPAAAGGPSADRPATQQQYPNPAAAGGPSLDIPCGETSCPPGCTLCIQADSCGRCLCGEAARICPAVPACRATCIQSAPDGCVSCSCPATGGDAQSYPRPPAMSAAFIVLRPAMKRRNYVSIGMTSPRRPLRNSPGRQFIRGERLREPQSLRLQLTGRQIVEQIPQHLLGRSRFGIQF